MERGLRCEKNRRRVREFHREWSQRLHVSDCHDTLQFCGILQLQARQTILTGNGFRFIPVPALPHICGHRHRIARIIIGQRSGQATTSIATILEIL
jgi:hypothetical protein